MAQYEYKVVDFVEGVDVPLLNKEGEKGWELVTAIPITHPPATHDFFTLIFIRRNIKHSH